MFHHFRLTWISDLAQRLNAGLLPDGHYALLERRHEDETEAFVEQISAFADAPDSIHYATRASRIAVLNRADRVVARIDVISPGIRASATMLHQFVEEAIGFVRRGIHLLIVDLFPPSSCPQDLHKLLRDKIHDGAFRSPANKPLSVAAYAAGVPESADIEPLAVGVVLPSLPVFLDEGTRVPVPLEDSYESAWNACPRPLREAVESVQS